MVAKKNSLLLFTFAIHIFVLPQAQLILLHFLTASRLHYQHLEQNLKNVIKPKITEKLLKRQ